MLAHRGRRRHDRPVTSIRRAGSADRAVLFELVAEFCAVDRHDFDPVRVGSGLGPLLDDDRHGQVWIAEDDRGAPAGYAVVTWSWSLESGGRDALLDEIYVRDRGRGLGAVLLDHAKSEARRAGAAVMALETEAHNHDARRFYARHGFVAEDSVWMLGELG